MSASEEAVERSRSEVSLPGGADDVAVASLTRANKSRPTNGGSGSRRRSTERYEIHLDRKLERMLSILMRLKELRRTDATQQSVSQK
jgi:hypothetical protein